MVRLVSMLLVLGAVATSAAKPVAGVPLEVVSGGLAFSGKYFLPASFDGHRERCFLDTGATASDVAGTYFAKYRPVGKAGSLGASNVARVDDAIRIGEVLLGSQRLAGVKVTRSKGAAPVIGIDLVATRPFSLHNLPKPELSWSPPATRLGQQGLWRYHGLLAVPVTLGKLRGQALWDTGAELSCVSQEVVKQHPEAFTFIQDMDRGRDSTGRPVKMQLYRLDKLVVGNQTFRMLTVLALDFTAMHKRLSKDLDFILGFNAIRQGNWDFDPAHATWSVTRQMPAARP